MALEQTQTWPETGGWKKLPSRRRGSLYTASCGEVHSRIVTIGQLLLFSSETGDAWLLDAADNLAAPLARDGEPLPVDITETDTNFSVQWMGSFRIDGEAFIYRPKKAGGVRTILGYPTPLIADQISNMFG